MRSARRSKAHDVGLDKSSLNWYNLRMMRNTDNRGPESRDEKRRRIVRLVLFMIAAAFFGGVVGCVVAYALTKNDILFIPIALCAVVAMITFTYARLKG